MGSYVMDSRLTRYLTLATCSSNCPCVIGRSRASWAGRYRWKTRREGHYGTSRECRMAMQACMHIPRVWCTLRFWSLLTFYSCTRKRDCQFMFWVVSCNVVSTVCQHLGQQRVSIVGVNSMFVLSAWQLCQSWWNTDVVMVNRMSVLSL